MHSDKLTDENFLVYCAKHYQSTYYTDAEFLEDTRRVKYVKKLLTSYVNGGV